MHVHFIWETIVVITYENLSHEKYYPFYHKKWEDTATEGKFSSSNNIMSYLQFQHNYHFDLTHLMEFWQRNGFEMTQGDEWIRTLFKKGQVTGNISFDNNILSYLQNVENDFLSPKNLIKKVIRKMLKVQ